GNYQIQLLDEPAIWGQLELSQDDAQGELVRRLETALLPQLPNLLRHQDAANLLTDCDTTASIQIRDDPHKLHLLTLKMKEQLEKRASVADCARVCEELISSLTTLDATSLGPQPQGPLGEFVPGVTSVTLSISKEWSVDLQEIHSLLDALPMIGLVAFGVLVPRGALAESESLKRGCFQLQIGVEDLEPVSGIDENEVWLPIPLENLIGKFPDARAMDSVGQHGSLLKKSDQLQREIETQGYLAFSQLQHLGFYVGVEIRERIAWFLTKDIVEHYLSILATESPALVQVTRSFFSIEQLTQYLRHLLKDKTSIADMPQVLERLLDMKAQPAEPLTSAVH
ncbi:MAG TPA: FHIPEP family type III secretion protein, partial [Blastocatellia bacterium]|nr:FHIPEP family type III secretion protein [Blastocatellia bacterium]